jgi:hypothetical protein
LIAPAKKPLATAGKFIVTHREFIVFPQKLIATARRFLAPRAKFITSPRTPIVSAKKSPATFPRLPVRGCRRIVTRSKFTTPLPRFIAPGRIFPATGKIHCVACLIFHKHPKNLRYGL